MAFKSIDQLDISGKRIFLRVDFNVPLDKSGAITDDTRVRAVLSTLKYALSKNAKIILASHLGRPKGKPEPEFSLAPVARRVGELLGKEVKLAPDCIGPETEKMVAAMKPGDVLLLENLRFHKEEEKNDPAFAKSLASLADLYVNDAFGSAHRAHASTEGIVAHVKQAAAGFLMADELAYLSKALEAPDRPFVAVLGGAKVSDKLEVIQNLLGKVDTLIIGGAMAYTFLKARGLAVGASLVEDELLDAARDIERKVASSNVTLELPIDHVVAEKLAAGLPTAVLAVDDPAIGQRMGLDIGPKTAARYAEAVSKAHTVVWNGPMGVFEIDEFAAGTNAVAHAVAGVTGTTIIGGGDSIAAVAKAGVADRVSHISTGGGASLEFLGGRTLPGVAALPEK